MRARRARGGGSLFRGPDSGAWTPTPKPCTRPGVGHPGGPRAPSHPPVLPPNFPRRCSALPLSGSFIAVLQDPKGAPAPSRKLFRSFFSPHTLGLRVTFSDIFAFHRLSAFCVASPFSRIFRNWLSDTFLSCLQMMKPLASCFLPTPLPFFFSPLSIYGLSFLLWVKQVSAFLGRFSTPTSSFTAFSLGS